MTVTKELFSLYFCPFPLFDNYSTKMFNRAKFNAGGITQPENDYLLIILILSSRKNVDRRNSIRSTWLKDKDNSKIKHLFAIGRSDNQEENELSSALLKEKNKYNDLLFLNVSEDYHNLSEKLLKSLDQLFKLYSFKFLLKCDDDTFTVIEALLKELESEDEKKLYWGFFDGKANVKTKGKWMEHNWFLCDKYLPYARGGGYILSYDLVRFISTNKMYLQLYNNEDVSVGVWLSALNIKRKHDPRFDTEYKSRGCNNKYLITHKVSPEVMRDLHLNLKTTNRLCKYEFQKYRSYIYNWNYPPSQCCIRNNSLIP
ncbi:hypothetical protein HELRODRAFT_169080 [Helobdella robusta]|uniref:Hexosyltransferase n=1 Tax=Helobdella robusta TaxID=6412 RepID=T1F1D5_HELRO|nr:hypothetical protein HELRODRAFT_169080 [Helobdella robusta]ESO09138.1 hypothetical protein HELRODRAFT_169080 [Helobdella robusta]